MKQLTFTREDVADPARLERLFQQLNRILGEPQAQAGAPLNLATLAAQLAPLIRSQLQATGNSPLNLQSLLPSTGLGIVLENTHANRNSLYPASTTDVGAVYWETDRTTAYVNVETAGVRAWTWFGGTYRAAVASRPVDLVNADAGFRFVNTDTDTNTEYVWSGTEWWTVGGYLQSVLDGSTASIIEKISHRSTGTPGVGFSAQRMVTLDDALNQDENASVWETIWSVATSGSETSDEQLYLRNAGAALAAMFRFIGSGGHLRMLTAGSRIQFEGSTSVFPALTRGATTTNTRSVLADGSASTDHEVADEAYGSSWNGSVEVPTKNAVYDKLQEVFGSYTDFTPTYSSDVGNAAATFTATPTTTLARYKANGKTMHVEVSIQATLNALVTPAVIYMTFPVAPSGADVWGGGVMLANAGTFENGLWRVLGGPDRVGFFRGNFALFTAGVAIDIRHSFVFDLA